MMGRVEKAFFPHAFGNDQGLGAAKWRQIGGSFGTGFSLCLCLGMGHPSLKCNVIAALIRPLGERTRRKTSLWKNELVGFPFIPLAAMQCVLEKWAGMGLGSCVGQCLGASRYIQHPGMRVLGNAEPPSHYPVRNHGVRLRKEHVGLLGHAALTPLGTGCRAKIPPSSIHTVSGNNQYLAAVEPWAALAFFEVLLPLARKK